MEAQLSQGPGGKLFKECHERPFLRPEISDEKVAKALWEFSEQQIERLEKEGAVKRALEKKEAEAAAKQAGGNAPAGISTSASPSRSNEPKEGTKKKPNSRHSMKAAGS